MAQLWFKQTDSELVMMPLSGQPVSLSVFPPRPADPGQSNSGSGLVILENLPDPQTEDDRWLLWIGESGAVWIDGSPQDLGLYLMGDGQEILVKGVGVVVLTTEKPPVKTRLPDFEADVICPRCKTEIEPGSEAVRCPSCGIWHHERDDLPCWTYEYSTHCAMCAQVTDLAGGLQRIPEGL